MRGVHNKSAQPDPASEPARHSASLRAISADIPRGANSGKSDGGINSYLIVCFAQSAHLFPININFREIFRGRSIFDFCNNICHQQKSVDLSITLSAHSSSTKQLGFMSKRPMRFSSSSSHNMAPSTSVLD